MHRSRASHTFQFETQKSRLNNTGVSDIDAEPNPCQSHVEAALRRPRMYTCHGTLSEICAFLEGYYSGICKGGGSAVEFANNDWFDFLAYLDLHLSGTGSPRSWQDIVSAIERQVENQEDAIPFTLSHYRDYLVAQQLIRHK